MKAKRRQDRALLLATAKAVAAALKIHAKGTRLRIRIPSRATVTTTDGWGAVIGNLGKNQPRLQVWLDHFSGYPDRKFWACFASFKRCPPILAITRRVSRKLWPVRTFTQKDINDEKFVALTNHLLRSEFNVPVLEKYKAGSCFYGIYDPTRETEKRVSSHFCTRAVAFFADVARALQPPPPEDEQREVYPHCENRKQVASHLQRERSRLLANECKIRDNYECQVCGLRFEEIYGKIGFEFAEAHHHVPLSRLRENVRTKMEDLTTVCANCHRMLHYRMPGKRDDIAKLRALVRKASSHKGCSRLPSCSLGL